MRAAFRMSLKAGRQVDKVVDGVVRQGLQKVPRGHADVFLTRQQLPREHRVLIGSAHTREPYLKRPITGEISEKRR